MSIFMKKVLSVVILMMITSLILGGCSGKNKEDAERLDGIQKEVNSLLNDKKDDLSNNVEEEKITELQENIDKENEAKEELSEENTEYLEEIISDFEWVVKMTDYEETVSKLKNADKINEETYKKTKNKLSNYKEKETYFNRMEKELEDIEKTLKKQ